MSKIKLSAEFKDVHNNELAEMNIKSCERMTARFELYSILEQGMRDVKNGDEVSFEDGMKMLRDKRNR